ncbi:hypothetical protein E2C01_078906 [Portunus trituberculatus]|uniref:Uncharacterized protein n=1 Tax=Portunus trituberculatus TaxID=210409 RepID=A0A5B7IU59_PORTR|nr:hypothetical protein [Portunus trituberculatus]
MVDGAAIYTEKERRRDTGIKFVHLVSQGGRLSKCETSRGLKVEYVNLSPVEVSVVDYSTINIKCTKNSQQV